MLGIKLICVGKLKEKHYAAACAEYEKRLGPMCRMEVAELPEESGRADGLAREAARILAAVPPGAFVVALCVEGEGLSSEALARRLAALATGGVSRVCFVIGSSDGLHPSVKERADLRLSMSAMTFPHHLARVMVMEQIYRALSINSGGKYHK